MIVPFLSDLEYGSGDFWSYAPYMPWYERYDPLYDSAISGMYPDTLTNGSVMQRYEVSPRGIIRAVSDIVETPVGIRSTNDEVVIRAIAWLLQFHTASTEQLACLIGIPHSKAASAVQAMWNACLIKRVVLKAKTGDLVQQSVWSLNENGPWDRWLSIIGPVNSSGILHGAPVIYSPYTAHGSASIYARHNYLTTEVVLRLMEVCPGLAGVWGERCGELTSLNTNLSDPDKYRTTADAVLVMNNGLKVLVESTFGLNTDSFVRKVHRLADFVIESGGVEESGTVILFVDAQPADAQHSVIDRLAYALKRHTVLRKSHRELVLEAMLSIRISDWFPLARASLNTVSPMWVSRLVQDSATSAYDTDWVSLLETEPYSKSFLSSSAQAVTNAMSARHMPMWWKMAKIDDTTYAPDYGFWNYPE